MRSFYKNNKIFFALLLLFFVLRVFSLGEDITNSDAIRWHRRSSNFLNALKQNEFEDTYQHYQPGVTLMWINSVVKHTSLKYQENFKDEVLTLEHSGYYPSIHGASKLMMVLVLGVLFSFQYFAITKLFNKKTATFYGLFLATEPFVIGIDRWLHLTSFETFFAFTSFLMLLLWKEFGKSESLYASAIMFALAVYSKLTAAVIAIPLLAVFNAAKKKRDVGKAFTTFVIIGIILFILMLPALWTNPSLVIGKFYAAVVNAIGNDIRTDQLSPIAANFFYPIVLAFKMSPFTLFIAGVGLFNIKGYIKHKSLRFVLIYLATYFLALMTADKKIDRYSLALFPPLLLLGAYHMQTLKTLSKVAFITLSITFTIWIISVYHPAYSGYFSPVMGGPAEAINIGVYENSGEFFAQAAEYLNDKEGRPLVAVPNNIDSFAFHYEGPVTGTIEGADYIVWSHDIDRPEAPSYPGCSVEYTYTIQDFSYVYIYNCTNKLL